MTNHKRTDHIATSESVRVCFIEMMGIPGSYDASVYDHFVDKDDEGRWFENRFGHVDGISITSCNPCRDESLPGYSEMSGLVLAGSYNSVHDHTEWQQRMRAWLPGARAAKIPVLAICGSHQLIAHAAGADVVAVDDAPFAGTFPVELTEAGVSSPLMTNIRSGDSFQYANSEHVTSIPPGATLLAVSSRVPVAALDYGDHWYSTQFHPEGTRETLGTVWRNTRPELMANYHDRDKGKQLVENFLEIVLNNSIIGD